MLEMRKSPKTVRIHEENEIIQVTKIGEESIIENITNDKAKNTCNDRETDHIDAIEEEQLEDKFLEGNFITKNRGSVTYYLTQRGRLGTLVCKLHWYPKIYDNAIFFVGLKTWSLLLILISWFQTGSVQRFQQKIQSIEEFF